MGKLGKMSEGEWDRAVSLKPKVKGVLRREWWKESNTKIVFKKQNEDLASIESLLGLVRMISEKVEVVPSLS